MGVCTLDENEQDTRLYEVVTNHEEQFSIWPSDQQLPLGWEAVGKRGLKSECLEYINKVWTDMRPLGLREKMLEKKDHAASGAEELRRRAGGDKWAVENKDDLVSYLCTGVHRVAIDVKPEKSIKSFQQAVDRGYVHLTFADTGEGAQGNTRIGLQLDKTASNFDQADFENEEGAARIVGELSLNYVEIRCTAEIDVGTLTGTAQVARISS